MVSQLRAALVAFLLLSVITGLIYPCVVTGVAQVLFPQQANGSLITNASGQVIGSSLIGQPFDDPKYFWGRLSATSPYPDNAAASSGSNLGPTNKALIDEVQGRIDALHKADPGNTAPIPVDLVTSSGSGQDPDISPDAALYQVHRVASARGLDEARVRQLVAQYIQPRVFGILGEERVNVLQLNLALDALK
jgi:potassium-transporting ATPase KdpC subunit